jgi:hypothetical protein
LSLEIGNRRAVGGIAIQAAPDDIHERRRKSCGQGDCVGVFVGPRRILQRESLDQGDAERPDVTGAEHSAVLRFRRIVKGRPGNAYRGCAGGPDGVARQFQLIIDDQNVWRFQLTLHQTLTVKKSQGIERRRQHFPHFVRGERPMGKKLSESLIGKLHHDEDEILAPQLASTHVEQANEVRMRERGIHSPARELCLASHRVGRNELDGGVRKILCPVFGQENHAVI